MTHKETIIMTFTTQYGDTFVADSYNAIHDHLRATQRTEPYALGILFRRSMARRIKIATGQTICWHTRCQFVRDLIAAGYIREVQS
jgi:hypothetical protein